MSHNVCLDSVLDSPPTMGVEGINRDARFGQRRGAVKQLMLAINNRVQIIRSRSDNQDLKVHVLVDAVAVMCLLDATLWDYARDSKLQDYSNSSVNNKIKQAAEALDACRITRKIDYLCQENKSIKSVFELDNFKVTDKGGSHRRSLGGAY